jgi:hypothetical protein
MTQSHALASTTGPADHFDPFHIRQQHILNIPEHAGVQRRICNAPIDQNLQLVGRARVEPASTNGIVISIAACDQQIWCQSQYFGKTAGATTADLDAGQLFEAQAHQFVCRVGRLISIVGRR